MWRIICNIISGYLTFGSCFYAFIFMILAFIWSRRYNMTMLEAIKQHFKKEVCLTLFVSCVFLWPISIVEIIKALHENMNRIKNGEYVTMLREVDEDKDNVF